MSAVRPCAEPPPGHFDAMNVRGRLWTAHDARLAYRLLQAVVQLLFRLLTRVQISGLENMPAAGPLIVAPNHLSVLDTMLIFAIAHRRMTAFAADKWRRGPIGWVLTNIGQTIYVQRGVVDRRALGQAMAALAAGAALGVAPEGTRSRNGGLQEGKNGVAYLASRTGATILPVALWGQETTWRSWARFHRPLIHMCIGAPLRLPATAGSAGSAELAAYTQEVMLALACMLPAEYRGVYAGLCCQAVE